MILSKGYFRLAKSVSKYSDCNIHIGCVISRHTPISVGFNKIHTHPLYSNPDTMDTNSVHAEIRALITASYRVKGCDIYIYRETFDGIPALARPCNLCYNRLKDEGIKKIYYTIGEPPYWSCERL